MSDPAAIVALDLGRSFGEVRAVEALRFEVAPGELFGLVGPDGAGKTTTLRMLAGVLRPTSGDARVGGISVARDPEGVKHHIAYMSQRFGLYSDLTVEENLAFYADLYRVPRKERPGRLERLYAFSNLGPFRKRLAGALSGGMKQKLGLSCALIHQPEILLLDEPTFGVDPVSRRELWLIVHEMVAAGVTAVVSTSYLDEAERFDRVAFLDRGRILALDAPEILKQRLGGELLEARLDAPRRGREVARALIGTGEVPGLARASLFGERLFLTVASAREAAAPLSRAFAAAGIKVLSLEPAEASLEEVFLALVEGDGAGERPS